MGSTLKPQTQLELSTQPVWVHFHAFLCVFGKTSRAVILQQQILRVLPWLKHTNCNALLVSFQQPARWASFTNKPTSQGSHCCFGHKEAFSLAVTFPKNIMQKAVHAILAPSHHNAPQTVLRLSWKSVWLKGAEWGLGLEIEQKVRID